MKCSLWLMPPASVAADLSVLIQELTLFPKLADPSAPAAPSFEPHVTLVGGIEVSNDDDVNDLKNKLQEIAATQELIDCRFKEIVSAHKAGKAQWNQSLVAILHRSSSLIAFIEASRIAMDLPPQQNLFAPELGEPHLSLFYGTRPPEKACVALPEDFVATRVALWKTDPSGIEGVSEWEQLFEIELV